MFCTMSRDRLLRFNETKEKAGLISFQNKNIREDPIGYGEVACTIEEFKTKDGKFSYKVQYGFVDRVVINLYGKQEVVRKISRQGTDG